MTASPAVAGTRRGRTGLWIALIIGLLVVVGGLSVRDEQDQPYDTASVRPTGTRAFVELLESFGTDVDVPSSFSLDGADPGTILIFQDYNGPNEVTQLQDWVRSGGTLVVTDPSSRLAPLVSPPDDPSGTVVFSGTPIVDQGVCDVGALQGVEQLQTALEGDAFAVAPIRYPVEPGTPSCFGDGEEAFAVVTPLGAGQIVSLGDGVQFMNGALGQADNAALATSLFAPSPGGRVTVLEPGVFGDVSAGGDGPVGSIGAIVGGALPFVLLQAGVAILVLGLAQGRRLGRPVGEPQPVQIASSELVAATGDLLQQADAPDHAAAVLRADLRRELCLRIGLPVDAPVEVLAATVDARTGLGREQVLAVVADQPIASERDLVVLAQSIDSIREEILHVPSA